MSYRWLNVGKILLDDDDFEMTKEVVEEFRVGDGPKIQEYLIEKYIIFHVQYSNSPLIILQTVTLIYM